MGGTEVGGDGMRDEGFHVRELRAVCDAVNGTAMNMNMHGRHAPVARDLAAAASRTVNVVN